MLLSDRFLGFFMVPTQVRPLLNIASTTIPHLTPASNLTT